MSNGNQTMSRRDFRTKDINTSRHKDILNSILTGQIETLDNQQKASYGDYLMKKMIRDSKGGGVVDLGIDIGKMFMPWLFTGIDAIKTKHDLKDLGKKQKEEYEEIFGEDEISKLISKSAKDRRKAIQQGSLYADIFSNMVAPIKNKALEGLTFKEKLAKINPFAGDWEINPVNPPKGGNPNQLPVGIKAPPAAGPSPAPPPPTVQVPFAPPPVQPPVQGPPTARWIDDPDKGLHHLFDRENVSLDTQTFNDFLNTIFKTTDKPKNYFNKLPFGQEVLRKNPFLLQSLLRELAKGGM